MSKPPLVHPDLIVRRIWDVPLSWLHENGIKLEAYDVDGTIGFLGCLSADPLADLHLQERKEAGIEFCFATNAVRDLSALTELYDALVIQPRVPRPGPIGELLKYPKKPEEAFFAEVLARHGLPDPRTVVMYDDKWVDGLCGAARMGFRTVLVNNMGPDLPIERFLRFRPRETRLMRKHGIKRVAEPN